MFFKHDKLKIITENGNAYVYAPYSSGFEYLLKQNIGNLQIIPELGCYCVPIEHINTVRNLMETVYKESDVKPAKRVNVEVRILHNIRVKDMPLVFMGIVIALPNFNTSREYRDIDSDSFVFREGGLDISDDKQVLSLKKGSVLLLKNVKKGYLTKSIFYDFKIVK